MYEAKIRRKIEFFIIVVYAASSHMSSQGKEPSRIQEIFYHDGEEREARKALGLLEGTQLQCGGLLEECLKPNEKYGLIIGTPAGDIGEKATGIPCHVFSTKPVPGKDQTFRLRLEPCVVHGDIPREVYVDIVRGQDFATVVYPFGYDINGWRTRDF